MGTNRTGWSVLSQSPWLGSRPGVFAGNGIPGSGGDSGPDLMFPLAVVGRLDVAGASGSNSSSRVPLRPG